MASSVRVILPSLHARFTYRVTDPRRILSGNEPEALAGLHRLRPAVHVQLVEEPARVGFHRVFADEKCPRNLTRALAARDVLEDLELASRDPEALDRGVVADEG